MAYNDEISIIYKIEKYSQRIKIFGYDFINNNKNKCKIKIKGKIIELKEYYDIENDSDKDEIQQSILEIKFYGINKIIDMSYMFYRCNLLFSLPDISKWDVSNVINMRCMFSECKSLTSLSGIEKWNTKNVTNMCRMFHNN